MPNFVTSSVSPIGAAHQQGLAAIAQADADRATRKDEFDAQMQETKLQREQVKLENEKNRAAQAGSQESSQKFAAEQGDINFQREQQMQEARMGFERETQQEALRHAEWMAQRNMEFQTKWNTLNAKLAFADSATRAKIQAAQLQLRAQMGRNAAKAQAVQKQLDGQAGQITQGKAKLTKYADDKLVASQQAHERGTRAANKAFDAFETNLSRRQQSKDVGQKAEDYLLDLTGQGEAGEYRDTNRGAEDNEFIKTAADGIEQELRASGLDAGSAKSSAAALMPILSSMLTAGRVGEGGHTPEAEATINGSIQNVQKAIAESGMSPSTVKGLLTQLRDLADQKKQGAMGAIATGKGNTHLQGKERDLYERIARGAATLTGAIQDDSEDAATIKLMVQTLDGASPEEVDKLAAKLSPEQMGALKLMTSGYKGVEHSQKLLSDLGLDAANAASKGDEASAMYLSDMLGTVNELFSHLNQDSHGPDAEPISHGEPDMLNIRGGKKEPVWMS